MTFTTRLPRLTRDQVVTELKREFPLASVFALDPTYTIVGDGFFSEWQDRFAARLLAEGLERSPVWDCDDYAALAKSEAAILHMRLKRAGDFGGAGVGVGMLCYQKDGEATRGHAVCIMRFDMGWMAWDPSGKTGDFMALRDVEKEGAWLVWL